MLSIKHFINNSKKEFKMDNERKYKTDKNGYLILNQVSKKKKSFSTIIWSIVWAASYIALIAICDLFIYQ